MEINIAVEYPAQPEIIELLEHGERHAANLYPAESNHFLSLDGLCKANVRFYVARTTSDRVVGTAAVVLRGAHAEIKRMWVIPEARGHGVAQALLNEVEKCAKANGAEIIQLETGVDSLAAVRLYERAGYVLCGPFADYQPDPLSVFMQKEMG